MKSSLKLYAKSIGLAIVLFGLLINPWMLGKLFSLEGAFRSGATKIAIYIVELTLITIGLTAFFFAKTVIGKFKEIMLLIFAIFIMLIVSNILLIKYYSFGLEYGWLPDPIRHHKLIPNVKFKLQSPDYSNLAELYLRQVHHTITAVPNSYGFLQGETSINDNSKTRILLLGDSFTAAAYLPENFADILEKKLNSYYNTDKIEIVNTGLGSYSPIIEYNILKHYGLMFKPKIVILNLDMTDVQNDFEYHHQISSGKSKDDYKFELGKMPFLLRSGHEKIYTNLKLMFSIWESSVKRLTEKTAKQDENEIQSIIMKNIEMHRRESGNISIDTLYAYTYKNESEFKNHLNLTLYYINKINDLSRENNVTFILHSYPHSPQISDGYICFRESLGMEKNKIYSNLIFDELRLFSSQKNITLWLSNDVLKNSKDPVYYPCDMHFNENGHRLVADFLFNKLINSGLLSKNINKSNLLG